MSFASSRVVCSSRDWSRYLWLFFGPSVVVREDFLWLPVKFVLMLKEEGGLGLIDVVR